MADSGESSKSQVIFVKTNIDTRLGLLLDSDDSVSAFKDKICKEHEQCFPSVGKITISSALKVNLGGNDFHLSESMILKKALQGLSNNYWFLSVDVMHVEEKGELQIGEVALANPDLLLDTKNTDPSEVVEKNKKKRKSKSSDKSRKKPAVETPTEAKDVESGEGNVTIMGENQHAGQEEPVDGHAIDVEANHDLMGTMEQDLQKEVGNADLVMIDEDKDLEKDNLLTELNQTSDDAENDGLIDPANATSQAIENETEMGTKEEGGNEEAKSEKPKKKKRAKKGKTPAKEDALVASSSRNAEENVEKAAKKSRKKSKKQESSNVVEEDA